jgi:hypothetical protein
MGRKRKLTDEERKERHREACRRWNKANPEKLKKINARWRSDPKNKEKAKELSRKWQLENPEKWRKYYTEVWYPAHRESHLENCKQYRQDHPERLRSYYKKYVEKNREKVRAYQKAYREKRKMVSGATVDDCHDKGGGR